MKNANKILSILPLMISGISCSSIELIHDSVKCDGVPKLTIDFTQEENANTPLSVVDKFFLRSGELQNRIKANCKNAKSHNKQYESN